METSGASARAEEVPVPGDTPTHDRGTRSSVPSSWEHLETNPLPESTETQDVGEKKPKKEKKDKKQKRNQENHEKRDDRGEPRWHGDTVSRWHQGRWESYGRDMVYETDPWANGRQDPPPSTQTPPGRHRRVTITPVSEKRRARAKHRHSPSSSPSSSSSSSSKSRSSGSSSSDSRRRRKRHGHRRRHYKKTVDHSKNVKIPGFDGQQKHYREYRRSVKRYAKLVGSEGTGLALQLNLTGEPLEITRHLSARKLKERGGVRMLLNTLDDEYLGLQEDRLDEVAEEFMTCRRGHGESMSRFIRRLKEARRELEEEDSEMYVSEKFYAWMMLRRSGLSTEEKSRVRGAIHCSEDPRDLAYALKRLFPAHRTGLQALQPDRRLQQQPGRSGLRGAYVANVPDDSENSASSLEDNKLDDDEDSDDDGGSGVESQEPHDILAAVEVVKQAEKEGYDVYAMYKSAKMQQRGKHKARGFYRKGSNTNPQGQSGPERQKELQAAKATSSCRACGEVGHWARDPICPKFGQRREERKPAQVNMVNQVLEVEKSAIDHSGSADCTSVQCQRVTGGTHTDKMRLPELSTWDVLTIKQLKPLCPEALGILDSGCQSTVIGLFVFRQWEQCLQDHQILQEPVPRLESREVFQFGNAGQLKGLFSAILPVSVFGVRLELKVCVVAGSTPLLLSRSTIAKLGLAIDFENNTASSRKLGIFQHPIAEVHGHLVVDLLDASLPQSCQGYKGASCSTTGVLVAELNPKGKKPGKKEKQGSNTQHKCSPESTHMHVDAWLIVGRCLFRIHERERMSMFSPSGSSLPFSDAMLLDDRLTCQYQDGKVHVQHDNWRSSPGSGVSRPWTGITLFFLSDTQPMWLSTELADSIRTIAEATWKPDPQATQEQLMKWFEPVVTSHFGTVTHLIRRSLNPIESVTNSDSTGLALSPDLSLENVSTTATVGQDVLSSTQLLEGDYWDWLQPNVFRRCHVDMRQQLYSSTHEEIHTERPDLDHMAIHIRDSQLLDHKSEEHGVHVMVYRHSCNTVPILAQAWKGETWFFTNGQQNKRLIFATILKHSHTRVTPRLLRQAWKAYRSDHAVIQRCSNLECDQVPSLLGSDRIAPSQALQVKRDSKDQGRAHGSLAQHAEQVHFGAAERDASSRTQMALQAERASDSTSLLPSDTSQHAAQGRASSPVHSTPDAPRRWIQEGGAPGYASSPLGETMSSGHRVGSLPNARSASDLEDREAYGYEQSSNEQTSDDRWQPSASSGGPQEGRTRQRDLGFGSGCDALSRGGSSHPAGRDDSSHPSSPTWSPTRTSSGQSTVSTFSQVDLPESEREQPVFSILLQQHRKTLDKSTRQQLTVALEEFEHMADDISGINDTYMIAERKKRQPVLLEVFAGSMNLSRVAAKRGWKVLQPVDSSMGENSLDLTQPEAQQEIDQYIQVEQPDVVTWAPPCGPYSPLQSIMPRNPVRRQVKMHRLFQKRKQTNPLWKYCQKHVKAQGVLHTKTWRDGQTIHLVENPWLSKAWPMFPMPGFAVRIDQCRFGLKVTNSGKRVKKPTRFQVNHQSLATSLEARCTCSKQPGVAPHDHIISGDKVGNQWVSRSSRCGAWPTKLCHHLLECVEHTVAHTDLEAQPDHVDSTLPYEVFVEELDLEQSTADAGAPRNATQELAFKLHCKYGHPANSTLARALRLGGAKPAIVEAVKDLKCSTCERVRAPSAPPKVTTLKAEEFNHTVGVDMFYIQDNRKRTRSVLSIVDHATSFHVLRWVDSKNPKQTAACFHEAWIGVFGPPKHVIYDQGGEFKTHFDELLESVSAVATVIPVEAHWKGGTVERHGSTAKTILRKIIDFHSVYSDDDFRIALQETAAAKNSLSKKSGFSPIQWVFGHDSALPGSVLDRPEDLAVHDNVVQGGEFGKRLNVRESARAAWLQLDNSDRIRRAILTRPRQQRETFLPGETVYFYHLQMAKRPNQTRNDHTQTWHGPGVVVAMQGPSTAWVSWRRTLLKIPVENLRAATEEETLGTTLVQQELQEHQKELTKHGSKARGFLDLTQASRPPPPQVEQNSDEPNPVETEETQPVDEGGEISRELSGQDLTQPVMSDEGPLTRIRGKRAGPTGLPNESWPSKHPRLEPIAEVETEQGENAEQDTVAERGPDLDAAAPEEAVDHGLDLSDFDEDPGSGCPIITPHTPTGLDTQTYQERSDLELPYGPVPHWKEHIQARQKQRESVGAHATQQQSKFARQLHRRRLATPRDVFFSEMKYLQDLEGHEPQAEENTPVKFSSEFCHRCHRYHKSILLVGVDEPLSREEVGNHTENNSKTAKEYKWKQMSPKDQEQFRQAMNKEWKSFLDLGAVKVIPKSQTKNIPKSRILPTRFILTNKDITGATLICKARMVCGGHLDPDINILRTDAPTADTMGVNLIFLIAASYKWVLQAGDVSTAFLSGVNDFRALYLYPPKEGLEGVQDGDLLEMRKGVYGLCNAPRLWWRRLRQVLIELGFVEMRMMQCVFMYWACDQDGKRQQLMGALAVHVDDIIICGSVVFEKVLKRLKEKLTFGKWYVREFDYLGRHVKQNDNFAIELSQPHYPEKVPRVPISKEQLEQDDQPVTEVTRADLRKTAGAACWLAKSTRPDLSFEVSLLQQSLTEATYQTVKQANTLVKRCTQFTYTIVIPPIDLTQAVIVAVSDASPGKMPRAGSQGGLFLLVTTKDICDRKVPAACMFWLSHRLKRIARSSLATESMALCEATEHGEFLRACFRELTDPNFDYRKWEMHTRGTQLIVGTDCRSIYDHLSAEKGLARDRILALDLAALKATFEGQLREDLEGRNAVLRWVPGPYNLADGLTKFIALQSLMISVLSEGQYTLADEATLLERAEQTKKQLKQKDLKRQPEVSAFLGNILPWQ